MNEIMIKMKTVTLLEKLKVNRETHVKDYEEACVEFRKIYKESFTELIEKSDTAPMDEMHTHIHLPKPTSYVESYDTYISMLENSVDEYIELDKDMFRCLVEDTWEWKRSFADNTSMYLSKVNRA